MRSFLWAGIFAAAFACAPNSSSAQATGETTGSKYLSAAAQKLATENKEAAAEYQKALDTIKAGNEAKAKGDAGTAYCQYGEAVYRLNLIAEQYPEWNREVVAKQLKNITDVSDKLSAVTCKNLEEMKDAQFRLEVWKRQVLILSKLDKIQKSLDESDRVYWDKWDKYIKDIWQRVIARED